MNVIQLIVAEFKAIIAKPHNIVVMVAVMCVPLLYAGMFLYSFWDAFGETGKLPVAVVNEDAGAKIAGERLNAGNELVKKLRTNHEFKWQFVSNREAENGFSRNRYFMIVRIPSDFSAHATTLADQKVQPAKLIYRLNADYNFISSRMASAGAEELKSEVSASITKLYAETMYKQINELTNGLQKAADGSGKLARGSQQELDGLNKLEAGFKTLMDGTAQLQSGAGQLTAGAAQLANGTVQLSSGAAQLAGGANTLQQGISQYTGAVGNQLLPGATQLAAGLNQYSLGMQQFEQTINNLPQELGASIDDTSIGKQAVQDALNQGLTEQSNDSASQIAQNVTGNISQSIASDSSKSQISQSIQQNQQLSAALEPLFIAYVEQNLGQTGTAAKALADQLMAKQLPSLADSIADQTATAIASNVTSPGSVQTVSSALQPSLLQSAEQTISQTASATAGQIKNGIANGLSQKDPSTGMTLTEAASALSTHADQLAAGGNQLASGLATLNGNSAGLGTGASSIAGGASTLAGGAGALKNGAVSLSSGASQLTSGLSNAAAGQTELLSGMHALSGGASSLADGSTQLSSSLAAAHSQLLQTPTDRAHAQQFAEPVVGSDQSHQAVKTFGSGFAPYFISLGLYVGALLLTIIFDLGRPSGIATSGWSIALSKFFITFLMSIGQSLLIDIVVLAGLGLRVESVPLFIGYTILTSMSFMAVIEFFAGSFDNEGRFVCIVILIMQLVSSGGAYAIQIIPNWLQRVANVLPMTYSVNGFRNIIDGHQSELLTFNSSMLVIFIIVALILTIVSYSIKFKSMLKKFERFNTPRAEHLPS
ncbi:MAG: YhgE/Pip domain-containing protein [Sporolactobacillus sp.]